MHKNFCILPFIHLATTTEGTCRLCCKVSKHDVILDDNGVPYNVNTHSIDEIWNSKHYRELRHKVWEQDQQLPECSVCWREEETFYSEWHNNHRNELPSKRRKENQKWLHKENKLSEPVQELVENPRIRYYDIRLSNLCNLKCRMCWPHFSSQIVREQKQFASEGLPTHYKHYDVAEWDTAKLWSSINDGIAEIEEITFVGGEPTLHDEMYELVDKLVQTDLAKNIRLKLTSNLTNIQQRFLELMHKFDSVEINGSIDGIDTVNNYIRYPSDWTTIERNIDRLLAIKNVQLNLTPVIQIYNIMHIDRLTQWYVDKWIKEQLGSRFTLSYDLLYDPDYLSAKQLNKSAKYTWYTDVYQPVTKYLDSLIDSINTQTQTVQDHWRELDKLKKRIVNIALYIEVLGFDKQNNSWRYWYNDTVLPELAVKLHKYTKQLDQHRGQNILDIIPNFYEITQ